LLVDPEIKPKYFAYEYLKEEDFNMSDLDKETFKKVYTYNPNLVYKSIGYDHKMCTGLIEKGYLDKKEIKEVLVNAESDEVSMNVFLDIVDLGLYNRDELKEMYEKSNIDLTQFGELPPLILYNSGFMSDEEFVEVFSSELNIIDGEIYVDADENDLDTLMSDSVKNILFGEDWWDYNVYEVYDNLSYALSDLTKITKDYIVNDIIKSEINIFDDLLLTKDNLVFIENDYYFEDENMNFEELLEFEELSEYKDAINLAYSKAQEDADIGEYYSKALESMEDIIGTYKKEDIKINDKYYTVLRFKLSNLNFSDMIDFLKSQYENWDNGIDYATENYGNIMGIFADMTDDVADFFDNYGLTGSIDNNLFNEFVIENINMI